MRPRDPDKDKELRKQVEVRLQGLMALRHPWDRVWLEVARFFLPEHSAALRAYGSLSHPPTTNSQPQLKYAEDILNTKLTDAHAVWAGEVLGNGMSSGLSSPSRPWFKLTTEDGDLREDSDVKVWLDEVTRRIYSFFAKTNFYQAIKSGYTENGIFGTEAAFMEEHWKYEGVTHALSAGEYWIGQDDGLRVDTLYRRKDMTAAQIIQRFFAGDTRKAPRKVRQAWDDGKYETSFAVYHACEPNHDRVQGRLDAENRRYRSIYWMAEHEQGDPPILSSSGFADQPFYASRWDVRGSQLYGRSPATRAYADARQLQFQSLRKQQAIDYVVKPALKGPAALMHQNANLNPGGLTAFASIDNDNMGPVWQVNPQAVSIMSEDAMLTKQAIDRALYIDLLLAITNMPGIQPRTVEEVARRNEEKMQQLGPVTDRTNVEKLQAAIDRAFLILLRRGEIPPPPDSLQGRPLKIEFVSVMAQMQRLLGLGAIERGVGFVGSMLAAFPQAGDKLDVDQAIDEYFDIAGTPSSIIRSDQAVASMREQRAQQQAAAAQGEAMTQAAGAAQQGADAARLLSETSDGQGASMLSRLLGNA